MINKNKNSFPNYFADAETDYNKADFIIFGCPYDKTSSFRFGSIHGPDAIREATWNFESFDVLTKSDLSTLRVHDFGNIESITDKTPTDMKNIVTEHATSFVKQHKIPVALGGEHSITPGIIQAFPQDTSVIILDAHLDFRESYEQEPLNHACTIKRISDYIPLENITVLGIRSAEKEEYTQAIEKHLSFYEASAFREKNITMICNEIKKHLQSKSVYLSIDIDVVDPAYAPGVGTPEPFGLHPFDILTVFDIFNRNIVGFDVVEVNPLFDHGQTATLAAKIIRYGIERISQKND